MAKSIEKFQVQINGIQKDISELYVNDVANSFDKFRIYQRSLRAAFDKMTEKMILASEVVSSMKADKKALEKAAKKSKMEEAKAQRIAKNEAKWFPRAINAGVTIDDHFKKLVAGSNGNNVQYFELTSILKAARQVKKDARIAAIEARDAEKAENKAARISKKIINLLSLAENAGIKNDDNFNMLMDPDNLRADEAMEMIIEAKKNALKAKKEAKLKLESEKTAGKRKPKAAKKETVLLTTNNSFEDFISDEEIEAALAEEELVDEQLA